MLKKVTLAIAATGLMAGMAFAGTAPQSGINGSAHDINALTGALADTYGRTCVFCHTPHNATTDALGPLWNRATTGQNITGTPYVWKAPLNSTIDTTDGLAGPSRLCMSCHDGSTAVDSHASNKSTGGAPKTLAGRASGFTNLGSTHPIGFKYADAVTARPGELVASSAKFISGDVAFGAAANTNTTSDGGAARTGQIIDDVLYTDIMTCATCHEVHNKNNVVAAASTTTKYNYFLRAKEEGSAICLSCHVK